MRSAANLSFLLAEGMEVAFVPPVLDAPRRAHVVSVDMKDKRSAVVFFEGVEDITVAERLAGCHCLVRRTHLPAEALEPEVVHWKGWLVFDERRGLVGSVSGLVEMPGQVLLEIAPASARDQAILVPLVDEFIVGIDEVKQRIDLKTPAGLLDL